ncbi:hypothetical protein Tco_0674269 [Tanacetum coccineum]
MENQFLLSDDQYTVFNRSEYAVLIFWMNTLYWIRGLDTPYPMEVDTSYQIFFGYDVLIIIPSWSLVKCRHIYAVSSLMDTAYRMSEQDDNIHSHHDDHQEDDAPHEGEKRVKRHKASKSSMSAREETVIDEDKVIPKDETPELIIELQDVDKRVQTIFDYERMKATLNDALSNQFKNAEEYTYHLEQTTNFMKNQIV